MTKTKMAAIAAFVTVLIGTPAAYAADQQITAAEQDYQLSVEMARQGGAHAEVPRSVTRAQPTVSTLNDAFQAQGSR